MITKQSFVNLGWLTLVSLMWGSQFPAYKLASDHMSDSALNAYSFVIAIIVLMPFLLWDRRKQRLAQSIGQSIGKKPARPAEFVTWLFLGVALLPASIGLSWGIAHSSGSNGAILYLTIPIMMFALAVPLLGERLTWTRIATLLLALIGAVCVSRDDLKGGSFTTRTLLGNAAILSGCIGSAFYNTYSKKLLENYSEIEILVYSYGVTAFFCVIASIWLDPTPFYDVSNIPAPTWLAIAALGGIIWGLSMAMFLWLLKRLDVALVSVSLYQQSFFGVLLSALMLGEHLRPAQIIGGMTVAAATLLADSYERRASRQAKAA